MCLSIPAKVLSIDGVMANVSVGGAEYQASIEMLEDVKIGDYVLLHTGFAIQKLDEEDAKESLKVFEEYDDFNKLLDEEEKLTGKRIT
ncbi:MAG: HypC/HybG/HupF family hydrogenase formation chaperone [Bacteroidetes bacterium]|jgi:hydrogenase expression/formation protein HypC|nr:HypC/HybG/HupF family hydrogenase formation chaperone [Bacteroidota bacterium]MBT6686372.1 HypC/HybG/HupF family hydrogenase formation chaperone [Bacteroidota bacterium]MBT7142205.1 HypC/HybG/HupF family hydrogenase formation chaperone [Bacteroidota bacterium]MBT7490440.1 HypC/HybG/HupF family hydrogenase formation chaperone [Bacteroidota bacterium]